MYLFKCDIPPRHSRYPPHLSWYPPRYWTPPRYSGYSPRYSWYPPWYWTPPTVLHTHYTGWFCEGMFRLEESQMFSFEIHTGWKSYKSFEIYTGWKSYKIQGDCQVFSIIKKLFIFRGGYLEYRGGCSVPWGISWCTWGDIMSTMGGAQHGTEHPHGTAYTFFRVKILQNPRRLSGIFHC